MVAEAGFGVESLLPADDDDDAVDIDVEPVAGAIEGGAAIVAKPHAAAGMRRDDADGWRDFGAQWDSDGVLKTPS